MIGSGAGRGGGGGGGGIESLDDMMAGPIDQIYDYHYTTSQALAEVLRQSEMRIADQLSTSIAADQRALTFSGMLLVVFTLLVGSTGQAGFSNGPLGKIAAGSILVSTVFSVISARPTRLFGQGSSSENLRIYLKDRSDGYLLSSIISRNDEAIAFNDKAVRQAAAFFRIALIFAAVGFSLVAADYWARQEPSVHLVEDSKK